MTQSLSIKDGNGSSKSLAVESGSYGYIPVHTISSSISLPVYVAGVITVNTASSTVTANPPVVTTVSQTSVTSFTWSTSASGTFQLAAASSTRKGLMLFNPGPNNLYISLSTAGGTTNGFTLVNTASVPSSYSFTLYPSGTYIADSTNVGVNYGGYFVSGSASTGVFITSTS